MPLNLRKMLAELMGREQVTDDDLRAELDELKIDNKLEALTRDGHLAADPLTQSLARAAIKGEATPAQLEQLIRSAKPTPAAATTVVPPAGPSAGADAVESAIQEQMRKTGQPYHEAAAEVSAGGTLATPATAFSATGGAE